MTMTYEQLVPDVLDALNADVAPRQIAEARLALENGIDTREDFFSVMAHIGYQVTVCSAKNMRPTRTDLPLVHIDDNDTPQIIKTENDVPANGFTGGDVIFLAPLAPAPRAVTWAERIGRFVPAASHIMFISIIAGLLALVPTLYNMTLYDGVIGTGSLAPLPMLFLGAVAALALEMGVRHIRGAYVARLGARLDHYFGMNVCEKLLYLPSVQLDRSSISAQIARLRDFESVREFFTGPLAALFFEIPLVLVYVAVMAVLAGPLALVPVVLAVVYGVLLWSVAGRLRQRADDASRTASARHDMILETVSKLRAIRLAGMEDTWRRRFDTVSANAANASFRSSFTAQNIETVSHILMSVGAVATLGFGVHTVIVGDLTVGGLVAAMMLVWRIVSPLQVCCASASRLLQLSSSIKQIKNLLDIPAEYNPYARTVRPENIRGRITFNRVSLRYAADTDPSLLGVSFDIKPGQVVAVRGSNGSGKSSILKLILGLYTPQAGGVLLDGVDIRQYDLAALRRAISYVPQHADMFSGTIRDNLLAVNPAATERECWRALRLACADGEVKALPRGLDTPIMGDQAAGKPFMLMQRLNLARAYIKVAPIILYDEASHSIGRENDDMFPKLISHFRNRSTVIMVTHREDHMNLADQVLVMSKGELVRIVQPQKQKTSVIGG